MSSALAVRPDWVDLSDLPAGVDPFATAVSRTALTIPQWLSVRRTGVAASEIATVLGESSFKTPYALFMEKTGEWEPDDLSDNEAVEIGIDLEEYCGRKFAERTGRKVRRDNFLRRCAEHPFLIADVDFDVVAEDGQAPEIAECKTSLGRAAFTDLWGDGPSDVPNSYALQVMQQLVVKGRKRGWIPALLAGPRVKVYVVEYRADLADIIVEAAREFYQRLIDRNPPPVTSLADAKRAFPTSRAIEVQASAEIAGAVAELVAAKAVEKSDKARVEELQGKIAGFMADGDTLMLGRTRLLTYKNVERSGYTVAPSTTRQFRLSGATANPRPFRPRGDKE
ncbi:MAG TPA: YqaJ viral recombinase family protein [Candidatus Tumulicola sp.]